ncbi:MAG: hypothetical protein ACJAZY_002442 [Spirosomataceae bacterium]
MFIDWRGEIVDLRQKNKDFSGLSKIITLLKTKALIGAKPL